MAAILYRIETADQATHSHINLDPETPMTTGHNIIELDAVRAAKGHLSEGSTLNGPIASALQPTELTREEAEEMREFIAHGTAYPTIPTRRVPEGDRSLLKRDQE